MSQHEEKINSQLGEILTLMRSTPERDQEMAAQGEQKFFKQLDQLFPEAENERREVIYGWFSVLYIVKEYFGMLGNTTRFAIVSLACSVVLFKEPFGLPNLFIFLSFFLNGIVLYCFLQYNNRIIVYITHLRYFFSILQVLLPFVLIFLLVKNN